METAATIILGKNPRSKKTLRKRKGDIARNPFLRKVIRKTVIGMAEVKSQQLTLNQNVFGYNGTSWATTCLRPVTPHTSGIVISQGDGGGDRVGNKIRTKKVILEMLLYPKAYDGITNVAPQPTEIIVWIFGVKENNTLPTDLTGFFQNGDLTSDPAGTLVDAIKTINTDKYVLYKKIRRKFGYANYAGSGSAAPSPFQTFANNDYKLNQHIKLDLTKYCPAHVLYNDNAANPFSKGVFYAIEAVPCNGAAYGTNQLPAQMYSNLNYEFVDI